MQRTVSDLIECKRRIEAYRLNLYDLLARTEELGDSLERSMHDPFELANYQLACEIRSLQCLGERIAQGLTRVIEDNLGHCSSQELSYAGDRAW